MSDPKFRVGDWVSVERLEQQLAKSAMDLKLGSPGKVLAVEPTMFGAGWRYKVRCKTGRIGWGDQEWLAPWPKQEKLL